MHDRQQALDWPGDAIRRSKFGNQGVIFDGVGDFDRDRFAHRDNLRHDRHILGGGLEIGRDPRRLGISRGQQCGQRGIRRNKLGRRLLPDALDARQPVGWITAQDRKIDSWPYKAD